MCNIQFLSVGDSAMLQMFFQTGGLSLLPSGRPLRKMKLRKSRKTKPNMNRMKIKKRSWKKQMKERC